MLEAWQRALRNCVMQVPDRSNLDYEPGQMALKPLEDLFVGARPGRSETPATSGANTGTDVAHHG